jgi:hypothetical protein
VLTKSRLFSPTRVIANKTFEDNMTVLVFYYNHLRKTDLKTRSGVTRTMARGYGAVKSVRKEKVSV